MVDNGQVVQANTEPASTEPASDGNAAQTQQPVTTPSPVTAEAVQKMIADAVAASIAQAKELGKRELQSAQDRNKAELARVQQKAQLTERTLAAVRNKVREFDPTQADQIELEELRTKERERGTIEQEELVNQQQAEFHNQFRSKQTQFIESLGLDPKDSRIDWADDAPNYLEAMGRTLDSVSKIQQTKVQEIQTGLEKRLKDLEAQIKGVNVEVNSVSTAASQGAPAGSDAEFLKKFGAGEIPANKENLTRWEKINKEY